MTSLQSEIEQRGKRIFELVDKYPESLFSKAGFYQRLMTLSMRDEQLKLQLFRFVAVLPSLHTSDEIIEHLKQKTKKKKKKTKKKKKHKKKKKKKTKKNKKKQKKKKTKQQKQNKTHNKQNKTQHTK